MTDKDNIKQYLHEIDCRLDWMEEELEASEEVKDFLLNLSIGEIDISEAQQKANDLYMRVG